MKGSSVADEIRSLQCGSDVDEDVDEIDVDAAAELQATNANFQYAMRHIRMKNKYC